MFDLLERKAPTVILFDDRGLVVWVSHRQEDRQLRTTPEQLIGRGAWEFAATPEDAEKARRALADCLTHEEEVTWLMRAKPYTDEILLFLVDLVPITREQRDRCGAVCGIALIWLVCPHVCKLTETELAVMRDISQGMSAAEIAKRQQVTDSTIRSHLAKIREKCQIEKLPSLQACAARHRWLYELIGRIPDEMRAYQRKSDNK